MRKARLDALRTEIEHGTVSGLGIPAERAFANARQRIADITGDASKN